MPILDNCCKGPCAEIALDVCDGLVINGLTADTEYFWTVTDHFGNDFTGSSTTNGSGQLTIANDDLPDGLLVVGSGALKVELRLTEDGDPINITVDSIQYPCLLFTVTEAVPSDEC